MPFVPSPIAEIAAMTPRLTAEEIAVIRQRSPGNHEGRGIPSLYHSVPVADFDALLAAAEREGVLAKRFTAPVVVMCGSTRFRQTWINELARLADEGNIVLSVGRFMPQAAVDLAPELKERLDALHKRKIDLADWVWVLDVGGYVGQSTKSEIVYAESLGRPIRYLSRERPGYENPPTDMDILRAALAPTAETVERLAEVSYSTKGQSTDVWIPWDRAERHVKIEEQEAIRAILAALQYEAAMEAARAVFPTVLSRQTVTLRAALQPGAREE